MASVDESPLRGRRSMVLDDAPATGVSTAASPPYVFLEGTVQAATDAAAAASHPTSAAASQRQTVGTAPGDAGSRAGAPVVASASAPASVPAASPETVPGAGSAPAVTTKEAAMKRVLAAAGKTFTFAQPNPIQ
jgi:hypothetical protein